VRQAGRAAPQIGKARQNQGKNPERVSLALLYAKDKKRALQNHSALRLNLDTCYLPFLPPLSSFLPFFFMEAPSIALRMADGVAGC